MKNHEPVFTFSLTWAMEHGLKERWVESHILNVNCAKAIEQALTENYHDGELADCAGAVIGEFGLERVAYVLAYTIQFYKPDNRYARMFRKDTSWAEGGAPPINLTQWKYTPIDQPSPFTLFICQYLCFTLEEQKKTSPTQITPLPTGEDGQTKECETVIPPSNPIISEALRVLLHFSGGISCERKFIR